MPLKDFFRGKKRSSQLWSPPPGEPVIRIHEDYWGMRNLYPASAFPEAAQDIEAARVFGEENRSAGGQGFEDIRAFGAPSISFLDVDLTEATVLRVMDGRMPRVRWFSATIGSMIGSEERDPFGAYEEDALCFGFHDDCYIKFDRTGDLVARIWFEAIGSEVELEVLREALVALNSVTPCAIADYWSHAVGLVADTDFMDRYFAALAG